MRIAIDCRFLGKSGIGTFIGNLIDSLLEEHSEHHYMIICDSSCKLKQRENVDLYKTDIKPFSVRELLRFPVSIINECDVFFSPYINLPLGIRVPIYCTIHDVLFLDRRELTSWLGYIVRKMYIWYAINRSKAIFTVSKFSRERICHHFGTHKDIIVTHNTVSKQIKKFSRQTIAKTDTPYIIYVGNIKKHKGLKVLLEAFQKATEKGFSKKLLIVGNADSFRTQDNEISNLVKNNGNIRFTGYVPDTELYQLIANADLLVLPSYYEGFGLTPLEALYLGSEVLISDIDVLKEIYEDMPVTFFKVGDSDDLAESLLNHKPVLSDSKKVKETIDKKYNSSAIANKVIQVIIRQAH